RDPGLGSFELGALMLRLRPFAAGADVRRATGLFIDLGAGGGFTGKLLRPSFEAGLGYGIALGPITLAPTLRYLQIWQPTTVLASDDARLALAGLEVTLNDPRPAPPRAVAKPVAAPPAPPPDRDHDGVIDRHDGCPDQPEDRDGYRDDD